MVPTASNLTVVVHEAMGGDAGYNGGSVVLQLVLWCDLKKSVFPRDISTNSACNVSFQ